MDPGSSASAAAQQHTCVRVQMHKTTAKNTQTCVRKTDTLREEKIYGEIKKK